MRIDANKSPEHRQAAQATLFNVDSLTLLLLLSACLNSTLPVAHEHPSPNQLTPAKEEKGQLPPWPQWCP
jgi:hypothetical protein